MTPLFTALRSDKRILWFTLAWFVVNLVQSIFTELAHDEAYYWMYARKLDIGYYDHPPMIALIIHLGGLIFKGEAGVRFIVVLMGALGIPLLYDLCGRKDFRLFAFILCASTVMQVYGFIAVPDAPLLFFTILFFIAYRNYISTDSVRNALFVALAIALLLYSKYHGLLVVLFTVISNFALFRRKTFYAIIALTVLFYSPHVLWQISHDYPSYQYHILNKSQNSYNPLDSLEFLGATVLVAGPLTGVLLIIGLWKNRGGDALNRALRFTFFGFVLFFLVSTFNSPIEANWMAASVVPLIILAHDYISRTEKFREWTIRLAFVSLLVFAFMRINLMTDLVPQLGSKSMPEFYGWKKWAEEVQKHADGCPVAIMNSYQRASKYSFYTNSEALSLNNMAYRRNQYDIWDIAEDMQGKRIALFRFWDEYSDSLESFETTRGKMMVQFIDHFRSYTKYRIVTDKDWYTFPHSCDVEIPLEFYDEDPSTVKGHSPEYPVCLAYRRYYYNNFESEIPVDEIDPDTIHSGYKVVIHIRTPDKPGPYYLRFGFRSGWMPPYINSHLIRMDIE